MNPTQDHHATTRTPADAVNAWVLAGRDDELAAWNRAYDALYPRPASNGGA